MVLSNSPIKTLLDCQGTVYSLWTRMCAGSRFSRSSQLLAFSFSPLSLLLYFWSAWVFFLKKNVIFLKSSLPLFKTLHLDKCISKWIIVPLLVFALPRDKLKGFPPAGQTLFHCKLPTKSHHIIQANLHFGGFLLLVSEPVLFCDYIFFCFWDRVSPGNPGCSRTYSID